MLTQSNNNIILTCKTTFVHFCVIMFVSPGEIMELFLSVDGFLPQAEPTISVFNKLFLHHPGLATACPMPHLPSAPATLLWHSLSSFHTVGTGPYLLGPPPPPPPPTPPPSCSPLYSLILSLSHKRPALTRKKRKTLER